jgi:hypothetical protein
VAGGRAYDLHYIHRPRSGAGAITYDMAIVGYFTPNSH